MDRPGVPRAKVAVPRVPASHLHRPRLIAALESTGEAQVALVCAPAGYGKTLLLAEWASLSPDTTAWVSLDDDDNDDQRFWSAVLAGLASCAVVPDGSALLRLAVPGRPSQDPTFLAAVVNALDLVPAPVRLVLDDVHEVTAADPVHGLASLIRDRPPGLHLVLAARNDPPLALGRMRLGDELREVRAEELRFSVAEADAMLAAAHVALRPDQVRLLVGQTDGWPAGLRLAALSLRGTQDADRFLEDFVGNSRAVSDYLVGEILTLLSAEDLDVLHAVSVCDPLSAPLAATLSGRQDAGGILDSLEHRTSLILSSGDGRRWYRVHPLLRSHLLADLQRRRPDLALQLHARAASWYAGTGEPVQALAHARRAEDRDLLARIFRGNSTRLVADGAHRVLREALQGLGERYVAADPWLALVAALVDVEAGELASADAHLADAGDAWPVEPAAELAALRDLVETRRVSMTGNPAVMIEATEPLDGAVAEGDLGLSVIADLDRALALVTVERPDEAQLLAETALQRARRLSQTYLVARGLTVLASVAAGQGDYPRMALLAEQADEVLPGAEWTMTAGAALSSVLRAYAALLAARPAACLELLGPALAFGQEGHAGPAAAVAPTVRALRGAALLDVGRVAEGLDELRHGRTEARAQPGMATTSALLAVFGYRGAAVAGRSEVARTVLAWAENGLGSNGEVAVMRAHRLSAMGRYAAAADTVRPVLEGSLPIALPWTVVDAAVLDCRLAVLGERRERARASLDRALRSGAAMEVLRPLALGPSEVIGRLTSLLGSFGPREEFARRVLSARHELGADDRRGGLTDRERAVLDLLPSQRSFGEIAIDLTVSHSTVKTHVRAIYSKLGVNSRRDAVDRARGNGLLYPEAP